MSPNPVLRMPRRLAQGCFDYCLNPADPDRPVVSGGAYCPEPVSLSAPQRDDAGLALLDEGDVGATAVMYVDAGAARFYYFFNLTDYQTRELLAASANDRRFELILNSLTEPPKPSLRATLDLRFDRLLEKTARWKHRRFESWVDAIHGFVPQVLEQCSSQFRTLSTAETCHCPAVMLPPWQRRMHVGS